jgi:hypothetical protein
MLGGRIHHIDRKKSKERGSREEGKPRMSTNGDEWEGREVVE